MKLIKDSNDRYKRNLVHIPAPIFGVYYNGREPYPQHDVLRLSDAFLKAGIDITKFKYWPMLELLVPVININLVGGDDVLQRNVIARRVEGRSPETEPWQSRGYPLRVSVLWIATQPLHIYMWLLAMTR